MQEQQDSRSDLDEVLREWHARVEGNKVSWEATNTWLIPGERILYLMGTNARMFVNADWLKPGDKVRITVERIES